MHWFKPTASKQERKQKIPNQVYRARKHIWSFPEACNEDNNRGINIMWAVMMDACDWLLCSLAPCSDLLKLFSHCVTQCLTNEKFLTAEDLMS